MTLATTKDEECLSKENKKRESLRKRKKHGMNKGFEDELSYKKKSQQKK